MEILKIIITSLASLISLFVLTKLMGNRQVSELTMFDYVIGISIGSIAAEMATDLDKPLNSVVAMTVYALVAVLISFITTKSIKIRNLVFGKSLILMKNGRIIKKNLKKAHLDLSEFLMQSRTAGYFDISAVKTAFMEPNGKISFMPCSKNRPITAADLSLNIPPDTLFFNVIIDGKIINNNLKELGYDEIWLRSRLKENGYKNEKKVLLATLDGNAKLNIFGD